jgi:hypothetical protein
MIDLESQVGNLSALDLLPERQFFHYAFPCLDNRNGHGQQVTKAQIDEVTELVRTDVRPRRSLLRYVFPDAYRGIGQAAQKLQVDRWTKASVERYFVIDHNTHLDAALAKGIPCRVVDICRVFVGRVVSLTPLQCRLIIVEDNRIYALNPLRLPCRLGDYVAIHGLTVVDVLKLLE